MKNIIFLTLIFILVSNCSNKKEVIKLSQEVTIEHVEPLGNGKYRAYFSYRWKDGHMIGTGIMLDHSVNAGDVRIYIEGETQNEDEQTSSFRDLR